MNILSIDFDIIMAPDIDLYNHFVNSNQPIKKIQEIHPLVQYAKADLGIYQIILPQILKITDQIDINDIRVSLTHEDIKNLLEGEKDITVFNIDHHHDLGYARNDKDVCCCANWASYYLDAGVINNYIWVRNENSDLGYDYDDDDERIGVVTLQEFNFDGLPKIDKVFLCLSPEWVPDVYHPLFFTTLDLINQQKNYHLEIY
jgi:hypothetical protein